MNEIMLTVKNEHGDSCGKPPSLDAADYSFTAHFKNKYGEQMLFAREQATGHCYIWMADWDWERKLRVIAGFAPGVTLNSEEYAFVFTCWWSATRYGQHSDGELHQRTLAWMDRHCSPKAGNLREQAAGTLYTRLQVLLLLGQINKVLTHSYLEMSKEQQAQLDAEDAVFLKEIGNDSPEDENEDEAKETT